MHGLGNDFVVIDAVKQNIELSEKIIREIADRKQGVGCDQVLVVGSSDKADFSYTIYNADGSQALHCGNGARCVARFIHEQGLSSKNELSLAMPTQTITANIEDYEHITIAMGVPQFQDSFELPQAIKVYPVSLGNPHAILIQEPGQSLSLEELGKILNHDKHFPDGVNVTIIKNITDKSIDIAVFERGVGPTQACGSAACASAALSLHNLLASSPVEVIMPGGSCFVAWPQQNQAIYLTGPATQVYQGEWHA
jgi:diaminopimelate epimerase